MAQHVKISSVGKQPPPFPRGENIANETLVQGMIDFWKTEINKVLPDQPDLIVLPEMCDRYCGTPKEVLIPYRKAMGDRMLNALRQIAKDHNCYIVYASAREAQDGSWRNAALMIDRSGKVIGQYNKNHTTIPEVDSGILCGAKTPLVQCDFGSVALVICFDLNFDELRFKYKALHPDLLVFPSMYHGGMMQQYWAYSCRAHFVGSMGCVGQPNEFYSPVGHLIASGSNFFRPTTATLNLDCAVVHRNYNDGRMDGNNKLGRLKEKYGADVTIMDPGPLGAVLITSESESVSIDEMINEFDIELVDDYFARSLAHQHDPANREAE